MTYIKHLILIILLLAINVTIVQAKALYVDAATGNDATNYATNDSGNPWLTLGRALWGNAVKSSPNGSEAAQAGDTVLVTAGTYSYAGSGLRYEPAFNPYNSGSAGNYITIQAVGTVNLTLSSGTGPVFGAYGKSYIVWDGFTSDESDHAVYAGEPSLIGVWSSDHITVQNCTSIGQYLGRDDSNHSAIRYEGSSDCLYKNNLSYGFTGLGENHADVYLYVSDDIVIENNEMRNGNGGVWVKGGTANNRMIVRKNYIYDMAGWGIRLGTVSTDGRAYQNLIVDCNDGLEIQAYLSAGNAAGNIFANNTVDITHRYGIRLHGAYDSCTFYNNIITNSNGAAVGSTWMADPEPHIFEHNMYYGGATWSGLGQNWAYWTGTWGKDTVTPESGTTIDPLFVDIGSGNYRLQAGSPALTLGVDILNLASGGTTAIIPAGAYITGNESIGIITNPVALSGTATVRINESDIASGTSGTLTMVFTVTEDTFISTLGDNGDSATTDFFNSLQSNRSEAAGWNNVVLAALDYTYTSLNAGCTEFTIAIPQCPTYNITQTEETITPDLPGICFTSGVTPGYTTPADFSIGVEASPPPAADAITGVGMVWSAQGRECVHDKDGVEVVR